ncbi:MAG TPA: sugar ABC transporter permease [Candidatus Fournierella pullicola]|uniref:Sugar ABC transporter permease n=1 Tax=Candidatus Allofournierella pullicola TaxID=2838596 RepID=A0A9D1V383_9FIRM|nr:sugar ABC transporter permease [Candidatus Fournierella pullicola]
MRLNFILRNSNESLRPGLRQERRAAALLLAPSLAGASVFYLVPFVEVVRRSFTDALGRRFVGLTNYKTVLANSAFRTAAANSARFLCVCIPALLALSLVMALLIRAAGRRGKAFSASFLLPLAVPVASIVLLWKVLFAQNGLVNTVLMALELQPVDFMGTGAAFWVLIATYLWKNSGYDMVLWAAGLDRIPKSQYEAAAVDGANAWQVFRAITWPGLRPTLGLTALLSLINSFKVFREAYLVAGSYPHKSMYLLQHLFNNWFLDLELGRITAAAVIVVGTMLAGAGALWALRRRLQRNEKQC